MILHYLIVLNFLNLLFLNKLFDHVSNLNQEFYVESNQEISYISFFCKMIQKHTRLIYSRIFCASSERNKCQSAPGRSPFLNRFN